MPKTEAYLHPQILSPLSARPQHLQLPQQGLKGAMVVPILMPIFQYDDGDLTVFGVLCTIAMVLVMISLICVMVFGVFRYGIRLITNSAGRIEQLTLLETEFQIQKLQQDPNWCESPIDVAETKGHKMAFIKAEAHRRARRQLFGTEFEIEV